MRYRQYDATGVQQKMSAGWRTYRILMYRILPIWGRTFLDQVRDEFGEQGTRNVCRNIVDQLRGDARDKVIGRACKTVLITHAVLHDARCSGEAF